MLWRNEFKKLTPSFLPDGLYRRSGNPLSGIGDSLTDIGALGFLYPEYAAFHIRKCQDTPGRFYRHPDLLGEGTFSRDHKAIAIALEKAGKAKGKK